MNSLSIIRIMHEACGRDKEKTDIIMPHTAMHYIISGYGYFNDVKLGAGQFFCALKGTKVCYFPCPEEPWTYIYIDIYSENNITDSALKWGLNISAPFGQFDFMEEIKKIYGFYYEYSKKYICNNEFIQSIAKMILSLHRPLGRKNSSLALRHVNEIKEYLDFNFYKKISIEDISKEFFLSRQYIRNIFVKYMKVSPKQYLQKIRMEKAADLLANTQYSIAIVSYSVGYEDQLAFSKIFKSYHGLSPTQYRNLKN